MAFKRIVYQKNDYIVTYIKYLIECLVHRISSINVISFSFIFKHPYGLRKLICHLHINLCLFSLSSYSCLFFTI